MYNLHMNDFFNRWSFNLFSLIGINSLFLPYFVIFIWLYFYHQKISINSASGMAVFYCYSIAVLVIQAIFLLITIILLIKERNTEFRIKNLFLLKICNNIFYKVFITILAIIEVIIFAGCILFLLELK